MSGPVDVIAENVEARLWDSQWVSVVNHAECYRDMSKEEAVATAVRMTEQLMAANVTKGFPPTTYNRAAVAELIEADRDFDAAELELGNAKYGPYTKRLSRYTAAEKRRSLALANVGGAS